MTRSVFIIAAAMLAGAASPARPCSVAGPLPTPEVLVERAELIVHARAERSGPKAGQIRFRVLGVHKGTAMRQLILNGRFEDRNDYNDQSVPYDFVRPGGRKGNCFALTYRKGGEYLLMLQADGKNAWSPYWTALSPTNEQITGKTDPWLAWVLGQLATVKPGGPQNVVQKVK